MELRPTLCRALALSTRAQGAQQPGHPVGASGEWRQGWPPTRSSSTAVLITYLFCFLAGSLLILLAIASGEDGDLDGGDGMGGPFSILLSTPFWSFGMAGFGLCGLLIHLIDPLLAPVLALLVAASTGLVLGFGASRTLHVLSGRRVNSLVCSEDLIGCEGRVTLSMDQRQRGLVEISVKGSRIRRPAVSGSEPLALNERVIVLSNEGNTLTVIRVDDLQRR